MGTFHESLDDFRKISILTKFYENFKILGGLRGMFLLCSLELYLHTFPESIPLSSVIITFRFFCHRNFVISQSFTCDHVRFFSCSCLLISLLHSFLPGSLALVRNWCISFSTILFSSDTMPSSKVKNKPSQPGGFTRLSCQLVQFKKKKTYIVLQNYICNHYKIRSSLEF